MESWVKKVLAIPVITVGLIICVAAIGAARANDIQDTDGPSSAAERPVGLDYVPLRGDGVDMAARSVVLSQSGKTYIAKTSGGLTVKSQNVLPLARVPIFGQLTDAPYERDAFSETRHVAAVAAADETLFVALPDDASMPSGVVIFNQNNAFILSERFAEGPNRIPAGGQMMANAFYQPEENNLLIMVRPSIILDGGLF